MSLSKKDYVAIAEAIRLGEQANNESDDPFTGPASTALDIAERIADYCAQDNPRFDRRRFIEAALPWTKDES